jgi:hypothetical protein
MHYMLNLPFLTKIRDIQKPSGKHLSQCAETQMLLGMHTAIPGGLSSAVAYREL